MTTIVTRSGKGAALTHTEVDANFTNLNADKAEVSAVILATQKGAASGVAPLDATSKISSTYLPSYVDDVLEYANFAALPATGETGKIYVALDTNKTYRWSGSAYVYITSGAVDSVAGKTGVVTLVKADVGLGNVDNTTDASKPVSTATQTALDLKAPISSPTFTGTTTAANLAYTGTFTGGTGVIAIGTNQIYKDASGNVGIGTNSPSQKLDILSTTITEAKLTGGTGSNQGSRLNVQGSYIGNYSSLTGGVYNADLMIFGSGGSTVWYQSPGAHIWNAGGASEKMRIDSSGNVGIGTSSPAAKLDVAGTVAGAFAARVLNNDTANTSFAQYKAVTGGGVGITMTAYGTSAGYIGTGSNHPTVLQTNNTERMRIDTSGNVGIGTSSPVRKLDVFSNLMRIGNGAASYIEFGAYATELNNYLVGVETGSLAFYQGRFGGTVTERMRIDSSGNVGIGTSAPNASAILDAQSTTKGVRFPNMTTTQKNAIASPAAGLVIFDTTLAKLCLYTGAAWQTITSV